MDKLAVSGCGLECLGATKTSRQILSPASCILVYHPRLSQPKPWRESQSTLNNSGCSQISADALHKGPLVAHAGWLHGDEDEDGEDEEDIRWRWG